MAVIFGPDTFTVGADTNIDAYPSGNPDYAYSRGSGSTITVNAANDNAENNSASPSVARVIDPAVSASMVVQEGRATVLVPSAGGNSEVGIAVRYSSSTRGYAGALTRLINEVVIMEDDAGLTTLASADKGLVTDVAYSASFRAVGGAGGAWLTLIINGQALTFSDTTAPANGAPGVYFDGAAPTDKSTLDNFEVDDLAGFPLVAGVAPTNGTTATTAPVINLPSGIQAGETLLILVRNAAGGTITFPNEGTDWVQLFEDGSDASNDTTALAWRKADGLEGATVTLTFGTSGKFSAIAYRYLNAADPTVTPPEFATLVTGTSATPDPGTVTPTGGTKKYSFIWMGGWEGEQTPPASVPTNYNSPVEANSGTAGLSATNCRVACAHREAEVSSEDPGSWTIDVSEDWTATVVAIHPAPAAADVHTLMPAMMM